MSDTKGASPVVTYVRAEINTKYADFLLLACCFCSGLLDSTMFNEYNTFVSMQTGNTIFVGLGASQQDTRKYDWARSLTAIVCYAIGSFIFSRINGFLGPKRRGTLVAAFLLQVVLLIIAAALVQSHVIVGDLADADATPYITHWSQEATIVLLSMQSAGQTVASRVLGYNEVPTVVITSLLCDLMMDPKVFLLRNEKRDRRIVAFVLTLVGAIAGGWISRATGNLWPALWIIAGIKFLIAVALSFWHVK
ncbi:DUF1275 domain protein [Aspergillus sclerotiicarbonarius CBS 121057]|uniref:DUF1275 domain protein n=1 Tax=Aspergillus sclerotiicarbonarius (strain CBS 121057 / IBT 28362) TaxID=1448318 RepID=A0A319EL00_ASPSB|nr:DUF1275 domain protein [Aspergillus sclerotiicarbonarius CBS 121057]